MGNATLDRVNVSDADANSLQAVCFRLGNEEYGVEITKIQEIVLMSEVTQMPHTAAYVRGLINLRSKVIPVIDLRTRFGLPPREADDSTRIMIVSLRGKTFGMVVDEVTEVLRISEENISETPSTVVGQGQEYLIGLARLEERLLILLDITELFTDSDAELVEGQSSVKHG